jgi:hypothetical protein
MYDNNLYHVAICHHDAPLVARGTPPRDACALGNFHSVLGMPRRVLNTAKHANNSLISTHDSKLRGRSPDFDHPHEA